MAKNGNISNEPELAEDCLTMVTAFEKVRKEKRRRAAQRAALKAQKAAEDALNAERAAEIQKAADAVVIGTAQVAGEAR